MTAPAVAHGRTGVPITTHSRPAARTGWTSGRPLRTGGASQGDIHRMTVTNPARLLAPT